MNAVRLRCNGASIVHFEPDGLLVTASMLPLGAQHVWHALTLQISYLGTGGVLTYVQTGGGGGQGEASMELTTLGGRSDRTRPDVRMVRFDLPEGVSQRTVTIWGMPGGEDDARGELSITIEGTPAEMTVTTRAAFTRSELPLARLRPVSSCATDLL